MFRDSCLICVSKKISTIIDLGIQPFADTFISDKFLSSPEHVYPLQCNLCHHCGQIQTSCVTDPYDRYSLRDYSYTSANSDFSRKHWEEYAREVTENISLTSDSLTIEIGSNDGYLLGQMKKLGFENCIGVDPSETMGAVASAKYGVKTITGLFEKVAADPAYDFESQCDLIIANNVFNHSNDPMKMATSVAKLLKDDGYFVYELPYWLTILETKKFDQIYHEHVSYFTATSSFHLLKRAGLNIVKIEIVDYHGGSLRVYAKKGKATVNEELRQLMEAEKELGVFKTETYEDFMNYILRQRNKFMKNIHDIKLEGGNIIAVGAAAKGNTFLNFYNLDNSLLDYVTDSSPFKQGKHTPLTRIPICDDKVFAEYENVHALILSWNISDRLKDVLKEINEKIIFLALGGETIN